MVSYEIVIKILRKGMNYEKTIRVKKLPHTERINGKDYKIQLEDCWTNQIPVIRRYRFMLMGIKHYLVIFREGKTDAIERKLGLVTPATIDAIDKSRILGGMFKELFKDKVGGLKTVFIGIAIIAVFIFMLSYLGVIQFGV